MAVKSFSYNNGKEPYHKPFDQDCYVKMVGYWPPVYILQFLFTIFGLPETT